MIFKYQITYKKEKQWRKKKKKNVLILNNFSSLHKVVT